MTLPDDVRREIEEYADRNPNATVAGIIGAVDGVTPADREEIAAIIGADEEGGGGETSNPDPSRFTNTKNKTDICIDEEQQPYIDDSGFDGDDSAVREHYARAKPVFDALATVDDEYPTLAFVGNAGWYDHRPVTRVEALEDGWDARSRAQTLESDWESILEDVGADGKARTLYNIASWKTPDSVYQRRLRRYNPDDGEQKWQDGEKPLPDYRDLRGFGFWVDLDLADELKPKRGALDDGIVATVEAAQAALIDEVAALYGVDADAIYGLDSGGGAYVYGPPEATLPITDHFDDPDAREQILDELRDRLTDWAKGDAQFEGMWPRVCEHVDGAGDVLDPDFMQNKNRQSKAPMAIHQDHDVVVTPLRERDPETGAVVSDVDYSPTRVSAVDEDLVAETTAWAEGLTDTTHTDAVSSLVATLWPEYAADADDWRSALEAWLEDQQSEDEPETDASTETDIDEEVDLAGLDITTDIGDVYADIEALDIERVAEKTVVHQWTDRATGLTDRSGGGKRAFVPIWGKNANSGNANYIDREQGSWVDTAEGDHGTAVEMALIAEENWPRGEIANGEDWARGVEYLRRMGFDIQVHIPDARESDDDQMPYWAVRRAALAFGILEEDDFVEREGEDGGTYQGFPDADTYDATLDELEARGVQHGRDHGDERRGDTPPTQLDVVLDPQKAWRAATAVTPEDLDSEIDVATTDDGTGWLCPRCEGEIDVVRAAAIDAGITTQCTDRLQDSQYDRAYEYARRGLGAPLPEYVSQETATERWDIIIGAIQQLEFGHLDKDALESEISGRGDDVDGDAQLTLDPAWRDSDSGESVLVFPTGTIYEAHPDHEGVLDVLRFVALDAGIIDWEDFTTDENQLTGDTFREAYTTARDYGAPLPRWEGTDAFHTVVLPPAEDVVDDDVGNDERLHAAYDAVGDLYRDAAETDDATLLRVLPGLGKTSQVFRNADEHPVLYTAGRKELMADAVDRADEQGVSSFILPVFAENGPPSIITDTAEAVVREDGQRLLRDRWSLVDHVEANLPDGEELQQPAEYDTHDEDDVHLDRESCPTADGEYGIDWWLAVHAARARGYRPQQIHENAPALFGAELPCCEDDDTCPYTEAWETATDPEEPLDVLVGHYTHAHVEGARTYSVRENGRVKKSPRVVALDEFPGEAFQREFGEEFPDLAAWLAGALRDDVDDRQDLFTSAEDLWTDETVRQWLDADETSDEHARIATALGSARAALTGLSTAEWLLEERRDACRDLGVEDALERLVDAHPDVDAGTITNVTAALSAAVTDADNRGGHTNTLAQLDDLVEELRDVHLEEQSLQAEIDAALANAAHVDGALASLVDDAVAGFQERDDSARRRLDAARDALQGGPAGCEALAMHADDGYAHPLAHALLYALIAPADADDVATVRTSNFTFGREEDTRLSSVGYQNARIVWDRNHHGAVVNHPPALTAGGSDNPTIGLDATGREALWELTLGREVTARDIHDSARERREFLRDVYGLQMAQTSPHANSYEGDPSGKNFDDDVELVAEVGREYGDAVGQDPAVLTTKVVEETLEDRLEDVASATGHYGDLKGSNALADHRLAVLLGCQHYGDHVVERWAALAGEEASRTGHGMALDYNSRVANTALQHMREDQVMQAALRFGRDSDGALVFAHTGALRDDLPVVADGEVVRTFSEQAQAIAQAAGELARRPQFTARDVQERVDGHDPEPRTVRRVLSELADFGYLEKTETPNGHANEFAVDAEPQAAEVDLPDLDSRAAEGDPGQDPLGVSYTWFVRVSPGEPRPARHRTVARAELPAPGGGDEASAASAPPG